MTQSQKRYSESLAAHFSPEASGNEVLFITSSTDSGVIRNGGRNGARFAPRSLLATFKKMTWDQELKSCKFRVTEVSSQEKEEEAFENAQKLESEKIQEATLHHKGPIYHIGGGHDHIYPLARALSPSGPLIIINLDAHADTRIDSEPNSGTPFRQIAREHQGEFFLFQIGLHPFSNSVSTLSSLEKGFTDVLWKQEISRKERLNSFFKAIQEKITPETKVIFSLDADAMCASHVPGVSAVNADGLSMQELRECWNHYKKLSFSHRPIVGIYELNPVYDTISSLSMRSIAAFIYRTLV